MEQLTDAQCDALREMGNIGAAHAATVLSQMMNSNVEMSVPEIHLVDVSDLHSYIGDEVSAIVVFQITGDLGNGGFVVFQMPEPTARRMTAFVTGMQEGSPAFTDMDTSAILEIGNIMVSAFLDGTAGLLNILMLPSPPVFVMDMPHAAIETIISAQALDIDSVVIFRTELRSAEHEIHGNLLLLPNPLMLRDILNLLEKLIAPHV